MDKLSKVAYTDLSCWNGLLGLQAEKGTGMKSGEKKIYVQMLGGFAMYYGRDVIPFNRIRSSKSVRLLQMLLLSMPGGISKNELIDYLYGWGGGRDSADYNNTLNVLIHRLKKQLISAGLPEDDYLVIQDGICRFRSKLPLEMDVRQFEKTVEEAEGSGGWTEQRNFFGRTKCTVGNFSLRINLRHGFFRGASITKIC